jgi:hypothetical protein
MMNRAILMQETVFLLMQCPVAQFSPGRTVWFRNNIAEEDPEARVRFPVLPEKKYWGWNGDRGCHVVSVTDPYGRILDFLDKPLLFYQVAPQLYSRG